MRLIDLSGRRFTQVVVLGRARALYWRCRCDCGNTIAIRGDALRSGNIKSCGHARGRKTQHGEKRRLGPTPEYRAWVQMIKRCENPNYWAFHRYGGRGIKVWTKWRHDFPAFLAHIGRRPSSHYSLDRIDNDGDYCPGNVRWATHREQSANR